MTRAIQSSLWAAGLLLIASTAILLAACGGGSEPERVRFDLAIGNGAIDRGPSVMKVKQGDEVTINVDSDRVGTFHLHGYDIETDIGPSETATMTFTANATGGFPITFHGAGHGGGGHTGEIDLVTHGALFESKTLLEGDTFSLDITDELAGKTVVFHNHMNHEEMGTIVVSEDGVESGAVQVRLLKDGSFEPSDISARPGATIVWTNASQERGRVVSGPSPGGDHEDGHGDEEETLGSLEVHPR